MTTATFKTVPSKPKREAPHPAAVLREAKSIIQQRGFTTYSLDDIAKGRSAWWADGAERYPINLDGAIELGRRAVYGNAQVPLRFRFTAEIDAAFETVLGPKWLRWFCESGRTTDDVVSKLDEVIANLATCQPKPVERGAASARRAVLAAQCDERIRQMRVTSMRQVKEILSITPSDKEIILSGVSIGELRCFAVHEDYMGSPRTKMVWKAVLPNFLGHKVVKEGTGFAGVSHQVAIAVTGILKRHAYSQSATEAA